MADTDLLDYAGLKSYDSKIKSYMWNWQKTKKAGAAAFKPAPESAIEPAVSFLFSETPPASGEKSLGNPSTIDGVSSVNVTRCGKNLAELNRIYALPGRGIAVSRNTDGSMHIEGTSGDSNPLIDIGNHDDSANKQLPYWMEIGKTYTLSFNSSNTNGNPCVSIYLSNSLEAWGSVHTINPGESYTFTVDNTIKRALIRIVFDKNSTINCDCYIQIEEGSSATLFDGTIPDVYTLSLGNTYYGGSIDLATGVMTVTHWGHAFDGTEAHGTFTALTNNGRLGFFTGEVTAKSQTDQTSTHLPYLANYESDSSHFYVNTGSESGVIMFAPYLTESSFLSWLAEQYAAGTPVTVVCELKTPFTVQLTPAQICSLPAIDKYEPRINTVYSDQEAVQVGYRKYANYVDLTTNQTVKGIKNFYDIGSTGTTPHFILNSQSVLAKGTSPSSATHAIFPFMPKDYFSYDYNNRLATIQYMVDTDTTIQISLVVSDFVADSTNYTGVVVEKTSVDVYNFRPNLDNVISNGTANRRWTQVFANTATISTSDERLKTDISILPDEVLDAWGNVSFKQFKMAASVKEKGDSARTHCGLIAQDIKKNFEDNGLDASVYGLYCYDVWEAQEESKSEDGEVLFPKSEAGDQYSLRYEEALCMEAAYMRRENARLKKRIAELEEKLVSVEARLDALQETGTTTNSLVAQTEAEPETPAGEEQGE